MQNSRVRRLYSSKHSIIQKANRYAVNIIRNLLDLLGSAVFFFLDPFVVDSPALDFAPPALEPPALEPDGLLDVCRE